MIEQYEFAKQLRNLLRRADRFGHDLQTLKEEILNIAELQEAHAERIEMEMIVAAQIDPANPRYDYGL
jgi:sensor histidine kinase YesM